MSHEPLVLVLMGGPDAEREVSIMSGREVAQALKASGRVQVEDRVIDKPSLTELRRLVDDAAAHAARAQVDVIFPVLHGTWGEGGALQELLDVIGLPYVGSRPKAARLAMDKIATKMLLSGEGVPTPPARELLPGEPCDLEPPVVVKPVNDGSSVDLRICRTPAELKQARAELHPKRPRLMVERYIQGRELTVGILMDRLLPIIEIVPPPKHEFYDYQAKYVSNDTRYVLDPELPPGVGDRCRDMAATAYRRLGCRDISRVDIMLDAEQPWFLEINTMPGFTTHSLVPMAARHTGKDMAAITSTLALHALTRGTVGAPSTMR